MLWSIPPSKGLAFCSSKGLSRITDHHLNRSEDILVAAVMGQRHTRDPPPPQLWKCHPVPSRRFPVPMWRVFLCHAERGAGSGRPSEREERGGVHGGAGLGREEVRGVHGVLQRCAVGTVISRSTYLSRRRSSAAGRVVKCMYAARVLECQAAAESTIFRWRYVRVCLAAKGLALRGITLDKC